MLPSRNSGAGRELTSKYTVDRALQRAVAKLPTRHTVLYVIGNLFTDRCQVKKFLF